MEINFFFILKEFLNVVPQPPPRPPAMPRLAAIGAAIPIAYNDKVSAFCFCKLCVV
jgi:hypothetical protein